MPRAKAVGNNRQINLAVKKKVGDEEGRPEGDMACVGSRMDVDVRHVLECSCVHWHLLLYAFAAYLLLLVLLRLCSCHVTSMTSYDRDPLKGSDPCTWQVARHPQPLTCPLWSLCQTQTAPAYPSNGVSTFST